MLQKVSAENNSISTFSSPLNNKTRQSKKRQIEELIDRVTKTICQQLNEKYFVHSSRSSVSSSFNRLVYWIPEFHFLSQYWITHQASANAREERLILRQAPKNISQNVKIMEKEILIDSEMCAFRCACASCAFPQNPPIDLLLFRVSFAPHPAKWNLV